MGRVNGNLAVSRSLGDYQFKDRPDLSDFEQKISVQADVHDIERHVLCALYTTSQAQEEDEFLILACDGIWDVMSNEDAMNFVYDQLKACTARCSSL
jgi:serine/threonine protein phosphatase PrpC